MAIRLGIDHLNRRFTGVASGTVTIEDLAAFAKEVLAAKLLSYGKVIDVTDAQAGVTRRELEALAQVLREAQPDVKRGPLALVTHPDRGEFATFFANLEICGRPARVFKSVHDARVWLDELTGANWRPARRTDTSAPLRKNHQPAPRLDH